MMAYTASRPLFRFSKSYSNIQTFNSRVKVNKRKKMPRTKVRNAQQKSQRKRSDSGYEEVIKEIGRITENFETESLMKWQKRKDNISGLFDSYRSRLGDLLCSTIDELINGKSNDRSESMTTNISESSNDDGYVTESSGRSSSRLLKPKRQGPLASALAKSIRRSKSANLTTNTSTCRNVSRTTIRSVKTNQRESRSKFRTPANRLQTMSADRGFMNPVTPKIEMNAPFSMMRYPKLGETIISMSGSPVIVNGGVMQNTANINIPLSNSIFSMNPTPFSEVDSHLVSRIDKNTLILLKQLQDNLAFVMSKVSDWNKN